MAKEKLLTTAKITQITGIPSWKFRYWDEIGKLIPVQRTDSGFRYYSEEQVTIALEMEGKRAIYVYTASDKDEKALEEENIELTRCVRTLEKNTTVRGVYEVWTGSLKDSKFEDIIYQAAKGLVSKIYVLNRDSFIQGKWEEFEQWLGYMGAELIDFSKVDFKPEVHGYNEVKL